MPRRRVHPSTQIVGAIATILILILLISGQLDAAPSVRDGQTTTSVAAIDRPLPSTETGMSAGFGKFRLLGLTY